MPFGGALMNTASTPTVDAAYFSKCIIEATGFEYKGKGIKEWKRKTGMAKYTNGKEVYIGNIPFHLILPSPVATDLLTDLMEHSQLDAGDRKN